MKVTKEMLKRIIKEELEQTFQEGLMDDLYGDHLKKATEKMESFLAELKFDGIKSEELKIRSTVVASKLWVNQDGEQEGQNAIVKIFKNVGSDPAYIIFKWAHVLETIESDSGKLDDNFIDKAKRVIIRAIKNNPNTEKI